MSQLWSPIIKSLKPYVPGEQPKIDNLIKLNTNENPYGPSPLAIAAMKNAISNNLRLYPDPNATSFKAAIATKYNISAEQVFVGNGSDEVLAHAFQALFKHGKPILFPDITYNFYLTYAVLYEIPYITVPLTKNFTICVEDYLHHSNTISGILFPNPNAPTGCLLTLIEIEQIVASNLTCVVIIDEAYIDFGGDTAIELVKYYPNLLIIQTLSKSRSLAGLRVGFAIGHTELIYGLEQVKNSFNSYPLDRIAIAGATAAIKDETYFEFTRQAIITSRKQLINELIKQKFFILPSAANFIFICHPKYDALTLASALRNAGIIVRHFNNKRIKQFLRITIGTDHACRLLIVFFKKYLNN